ncbi:cytidylate kinase-like family protein [Clostridiaceae bacterium AF29-16BH]|jgi:CMP/dCMP kinase|nr:cytidylate kinase-like family protein [Clostridiaceae bacterium]MDY4546857.1 cytidylate kinase-like family protein [Candidatus Choladocola sp.]RGD89157.1 cytidylate kinase-like family protein [Clostridiales bacterium AM23-16LB]RHP47135.1 cytidylate kinase-like family protein [Clostridiaceae bacterium AF31-3BH]RHQ22064.1 cytidylate kinase-like family protein [Clostridiaceae bacterium AF29-16BH]RHR42602.1 cytidylate kinase-like family protein [Clostridiaceae bacterium AF18-31LB]RHT80099.1 cy
MKKKIVTISRQYGSGGRYIGENLAKAMGVPCYDEKLIDMVAKESGFAQSFVAEKGERMTGSLLFNIASSLSFANNVFSTNNGVTLQDEIYFTQNRIIKELADKGPCVIVGRCADYILREREDCLNVFIFADNESKIERAEKYFNITREEAPAVLKKKDKARANHYKYYTDQEWGMASNYDLCLNSGLIGIEGCVKAIQQVLELTE